MTDTHFGVRSRPPEAAKSILDSQYALIHKTILPLIDREEIDTVFHLGDLVHDRTSVPYEVAEFIYQNLIKPLVERGVKMWFLAGNHDCGLTSTNKKNCYTTLLRGCGNNFRVIEETTEIEFDGMRILMVPWINPSNKEQSYSRIRSSKARVMFGHIGISGFLPGSSHVSEHPASMFQHFDACFLGHYHNRKSDGNIHFIGAFQQTEWGDDNERGFCIFDTEKQRNCNPDYETGMEFIRNPYKVFVEFIYNDETKTEEQMLGEINSVDLRYTIVRLHIETRKRPEVLRRVQELLKSRCGIPYKTKDDATITVRTGPALTFEREDILSTVLRSVDQADVSNADLVKKLIKRAHNAATYNLKAIE